MVTAEENTPKIYTPELLIQDADYGVLKQLQGTWVNHNPENNNTGWGLHTTCMPSPGSEPRHNPWEVYFFV